jgi:hypothetical protein
MGTFVGRRARHPRSPLLVASVVVAALQLALVGPVLAADPPADVVLDGVVTVTFVAEGSDPVPLADATVSLEASRPTIEPVPFQTLTATTDADGRAEFSGVARGAEGADPVSLAVTATLTRANDCGGSETFDGATTVDAAAEVTVELVGSAASSCVAFPIIGLVIGADGEPFAVAEAAATITYPDSEAQTVAVDVAADGSFAILLRGWAGGGSTEVQLLVLGETRQVPGDDGCTDVVADIADVAWTLDAPQAPDPSLVLASPTVVGSVCDGGLGTPAPEAPAPQAPAPVVTLPPTDALPGDPAASATRDPAGATLLVLGILALAAAGGWRLSRRGS